MAARVSPIGKNAPRRRSVSPIGKNAKFARIDQGVDWNQSEPYKAIGSGTVTNISHGFTGIAPGDDWGVYIKLDHPIIVNGRTYGEVYYAETRPLVKVGQRVKAGQPVTVGGAAEIGFARGSAPAAPLTGGLGAGTQRSQAGQDFFDFVTHAHQVTGTPQPQPQTAPTGQTGASQFMSPQPLTPPSEQGMVGGAAPELPGSVQYTTHPYEAAQLWQQVAGNDFVSPDTQNMLMNAQLATGSNAG